MVLVRFLGVKYRYVSQEYSYGGIFQDEALK